MPEEKLPQITLTIFLIKKEFLGINDFIKDLGSLDLHTIKNGDVVIGELLVRAPIIKSPDWGKFFNGYVDMSVLGKTSTTAAVLTINVENRWFAVVFGQGGRYLLKPECWEERFGLLVALNSIGQNQIRSIDKRKFDAFDTHSRIQSTLEATTQDFGLDVEQDLVRAVTGTPLDKLLGQRLTGMDALKASVRIKIEQIFDQLRGYNKQFNSKEYKKFFPWVDHIAEVTNKRVKEELDGILEGRVRQRELDRCWLAVPEIIEWAHIDGFCYGRTNRNAKYHDVHFPEFLDEVRDSANITIDILRRRQIYCIGDDDHPVHKWSVYKCIYCELDYNEDSYVLSGGKWYLVSQDFVQEVNGYFNKIRRYSSELPEYNDSSEGKYNERIANEAPDVYALMDRKPIMFGGGRNNFEFCDLYTKDKDIIHVKRYGQSSVFSHFFAQGTNSGELFHTQPEFRNLVNKKLPLSHKIKNSDERPNPGEYQVVFAIVSDSEGEDITIPFFSRLNLRAAVSRLEGYGYRVALAKVPVSRFISKLKRY